MHCFVLFFVGRSESSFFTLTQGLSSPVVRDPSSFDRLHPARGLHTTPGPHLNRDYATAAYYKAAMVLFSSPRTLVPCAKIKFTFREYDPDEVWRHLEWERRRFKGRKEDYVVIKNAGRRAAPGSPPHPPQRAV